MTIVTHSSQATQSISRVRHPDKYQCVLLCIEKEKAGFECVKPIRKVNKYSKHFRHNGKESLYNGFTDNSYYEAVYRKKFEVRA